MSQGKKNLPRNQSHRRSSLSRMSSPLSLASRAVRAREAASSPTRCGSSSGRTRSSSPAAAPAPAELAPTPALAPPAFPEAAFPTRSSTVLRADSTAAPLVAEAEAEAATARRWATRAYMGFEAVVDQVGMRKPLRKPWRSGSLPRPRGGGMGGRPRRGACGFVFGGTSGGGREFGVCVYAGVVELSYGGSSEWYEGASETFFCEVSRTRSRVWSAGFVPGGEGGAGHVRVGVCGGVVAVGISL